MATVRLASIVVGCTALLSVCAPAWAQDQRPSRPYRGLFGRDSRDAAQVLAVNGTAGIGYDTDVLVAAREESLNGSTPPLARTADYFGALGGGLYYEDHGQRYDFGASIQSLARRYSRYSTMSSHVATVNGSVRLGRRTTLTGSQTVTYEPLGAFFRFPTLFEGGIGQIEAPSPDFGVVQGSYTTYSTAANASRQLSRRSSIAASYYDSTGSLNGSSTAGFRTQQGFVRYGHKITRNTGVHASYGYTDARYRDGQDAYHGDTYDGGVDYLRDLSVSRRTKLAISTGLGTVQDGRYTRYFVTGTGTLSREMGRTWEAAAMYTRGVSFFETVRLPYFYDSVTLAVSGLIARRLQVHSSAGATVGDLSSPNPAVSPRSNRFATAYGGAGILYVLSRYAGVSADYAIYGYSIDDASVLTHGLLQPQLARHTVTVSLRAWAPIVERGRRPNAAR
jgi:hypothetical protein